MVHPEPLSDLRVIQSLSREQHNTRALRERLRARSATRPTLKRERSSSDNSISTGVEKLIHHD
jgi:hypothetical protein